MSFTVDIQRDSGEDTPDDEDLRRAIGAALALAPDTPDAPELSLRIVGRSEMQQLNGTYRGRDYATNVLSFPADLPAELELPLLGDIAICAPVVNDEAREQGKESPAHWEHMLVHGVLHLLGYDHQNDTEADEMEALETRILQRLGRPDPYLIADLEEAQL